ncbi:MAG: ion transporter [Planctomycetota bacterium]|nr:MAG: ion transporter [Planctomycetota bacterium]
MTSPRTDPPQAPPRDSWRERLYVVIFEADTPAGKAFDVALLLLILASVLVTVVDSLPSLSAEQHDQLLLADWVFTVLFTVEYVLRLMCVRRKLGYALSTFGIIDFVAIVPTYLSLLDLGFRGGAVVRALRLLRVFRIFKLGRFLTEAATLRQSLRTSRAKVTVFLTFVLILICIMGAAMYLVEGPESGFASIPDGIYWAVVTVTTVGYGDLSPITPWGKALAAFVMLLGYSILVIPGGIISAEWVAARQHEVSTQVCPDCTHEGHEIDADFCKRCGGRL